MCLRRSIPSYDARRMCFTKAVRVAFNNKSLLSRMLLSDNIIRVNISLLNQYLNLYANEHSIELSEIQYQALDKFYIRYEHGFYTTPTNTKRYLIPQSYSEHGYNKVTSWKINIVTQH